MRKHCVVALTVAFLFVSGGFLVAAEHPLDAIPESAGVVVRLKSPKATLARIAEFAGKADPTWKAFLDAGSERLGLMVYNQSLAGVDTKGDWWVAVFPTAGGDPGILFAVPVTDAEAAKKETGTNYQYVKYQNWLLYTDHMETFKAVENRSKGEGKPITPVIDRTSRGLVDKADIAAFVNIKQLLETYRNDIDNMKQQVEQGLKQAQQAQPPIQGMNLGAALNVYADLGKGLLQALEESEGYTVAGTVGDAGVDIEQYLKVASGSATDKFLQANKPSEFASLGKLPADQLMYYGLHGDMESMVKWGMNATGAMFEGSNTEAKTAFQATAAEIAKLKFGDTVGSVALGKIGEGVIRYMNYVQVDQPEKLKELYRNSSTAMAKLAAGPVKQEMTIEKDAEKYGDRSADLLKLKQEITPEGDPLGVQKRVMDMMYGPEGMVTRIVTLKDSLVQTMGGGKEAMESLLKAADSSAAPSDARKASRDHLSKQANLVFLIDLPGLISEGLKLASGSGAFPIPIDAAALDKIAEKRSFIGTTAVTEPQALRFKTFFPLEQLQGIAELVKMAQSMSGGGT